MNNSTTFNLIESLRKRILVGVEELYKDDLMILMGQVLADINAVCPIAELETKVQAIETPDIQTVKKFFDILADQSIPDSAYPLPNDNPSSYKDTVEQLRTTLESIEGHEVELGPLEILLRAELFLDARFNTALICLIDNQTVLSKLKRAVTEKLNSLSDEVVADLWRAVRSEFDTGSWSKGLPLDIEIVGANFLAQDPPDTTRKKFADFVVFYKPKLWLKAFREGLAVPIRSPGLGRLGLIQSSLYRKTISRIELLVFNSLLRSFVLWELGTGQDPQQLIAEFGVLKTGRLIGSNEFDRVKRGLRPISGDAPQKYLSLLLDELVNLENLNLEYLSKSGPEERALISYKLSLELFHDSEHARIESLPSRKKELTLQKELCRYLLGRDILSYGVSFADGEIDLLLKGDGREPFVIEAKVFNSRRRPNRDRILKSLTQLLSYMTQHTQSRGTLFLYNLSDIVIVTPDVWIKDRIACIAVNLGKKRPSEREQSLVISRSTVPNELVTIQSVN